MAPETESTEGRITTNSLDYSAREAEKRNQFYHLDEKDEDILRALQQNARLTNKELAAKIHLSTTPTFERVKRLERLGYIQQYTAILNASKLNKGFTVFCSVKLRRLSAELAEAFTNMVRQVPEVTECYNISGAYDYLLKVRARDMKQYQEFVLNKLGDIDSLGSVESIFVMSEEKQNYGINL